MTILDEIPLRIDEGALRQRLCIGEEGEDAAAVRSMAESAEAAARPKAMYRTAYIDSRDGDTLVIDGVSFHSRVMAKNLEGRYKVWPYIATCGMELYGWVQGFADPLERYWAEAIMEAALRCAVGALEQHLRAHAFAGRTAVLSPGSLPDWPTHAQPDLFALLGNPAQAIGVTLTESLMMVPNKSVSGLRFPNDTGFASCRLCRRNTCPGRSAEFDEELHAETFGE